MTRLLARDHLPYLEGFTTAFAGVLRTGDLDARVTSCGDWRLSDLGAHLGGVHRWAAEVVRTGEACHEKFAPEPGALLADWYVQSASTVLGALHSADPADRCWHFGRTETTKAFWFRRQVHETAVHLLDAHDAVGERVELPEPVVADGVDEVFTAMLPRITRWYEPPPLPGPLLVRASDTGDTWLLVPGAAGGPPALAETGEPASTVEAPAIGLLRLLWKRATLDDVAPVITGDEKVATGFLTARLTP